MLFQFHILGSFRTPVRHVLYLIRHTALSSTYAIVAYARHNNNASTPVFGIPAFPRCENDRRH